jgi:serine/threonine-protein kinase TNNI3K
MAPSRRVGEEEPQDLEEGTGESSPAPRSPRQSHPDLHAVQRRICERLRLTGRHGHKLADPSFHGRLARHLQRLPRRYIFDFDAEDKAEDVLLHWEILQECADPYKRPVFHARYLKVPLCLSGSAVCVCQSAR